MAYEVDIKEMIQALYIAYWGRPGDPEGLSYWLTQYNNGVLDLAGIADNFAMSQEAQDEYAYFNAVFNYPALLTDEMREEFVKQVYQNIFERDPDADGLAYWTEQLKNAQTPGQFIAHIIDTAYQGRNGTGQTATDWLTVYNKIQVAEYFTDYLVANNIDWTMALSDQVEAVLDTVTSTTDVADAQGQVQDILEGQEVVGQTYTLTLNPDTFTGTAGNDIFNGVLDKNGNVTFQSFDQLNGGDGTDTLIAQGIGNLTTNTTTLQNIEVLQIVQAVKAKTLDLTNTTGVTRISSETPTGTYTVTGIGAGIERIDVIAPGGTTQTFQFQAGAVSGSADSLTLGIQSFGTAAARTINLNPVTGTNGFETLNIELSGGASNVKINDGAATTLTTVNVSGSPNATIDLTTPASVTTVDASEATGNLVFTLAYAKNITATGGSGNDEFEFGATFNTNDVVKGGGGTDTLAANAAQFAAFTTTASNISSIERIRVQDAIAGKTIDVSLFGVDYVRLANSTGKFGQLGNLSSGSTIRVDGDLASAATATTQYFQAKIKNAASGKADTLSFDLRATTAAGLQFVAANDVETINVTTADAKAANNFTLLAKDAATKGYALTVNLTGDNDLTFALNSNHATNTVDGSAMTAALTANLSNVTGGPATLKGGSGADVLTGGFGADTLTGNGGADGFNFNNFAAADTITDFSATADNIYIDAKNAVFNAMTAPNGIKVGTAIKIWTVAGANATALTMAVTNAFGAAVMFTSKQLFVAANKGSLTAAIKAAVGATDARGVAFGKVGNTLYLVYVGDTKLMATTGMNAGTTISAIRTIAKVGAGFTAADLFLY